MKKVFLVLALFLAAQVSRAEIYSASFSFNPASSPTDSVVVFGSDTNPIYVYGFAIDGQATALSSQVLSMAKRSTADTGGTPVTLTLGAFNSASSPSTARVVQYTSNPTLGTLDSYLFKWTQVFNSGLTGIVGISPTTFSTPQLSPNFPIILRGSNECVAINFGGTKPLGAMITGFVIINE